MKVMAIYGSHRSPTKSDTVTILKPFLEGMEEMEGVEIEHVHLRKLKLKPCIECKKCWLNDEGECIHKDAMTTGGLFRRMVDADVWVLATPVLTGAPSDLLMVLTNRLFPTGKPKVDIKDGRTYRPRWPWMKKGCKAVLISVCAAWELDEFDPLVCWTKRFCQIKERELSAMLLRPHGGLLSKMKENKRGFGRKLSMIFRMAWADWANCWRNGRSLAAFRSLMKVKAKIRSVEEAAKEAGRQMASEGKIRPETIKAVSQPLMPLSAYSTLANLAIGDMIAEEKRKEEKRKNKN